MVAIDADPDANLAMALGATDEQAAACIPLSKQDALIEERTGAAPGKGGMFILNPDVSDVVDTCGVDVNGVTLLRTGTVELGGGGCMCSEGTFLKAFMRHLLLDSDDVAILDMEAGIEHLGRGTAEGVDVFVVVVEPGMRCVSTAHVVRSLAADLGVRDVVAVGNRVRGPEDVAYLQRGSRRHRAHRHPARQRRGSPSRPRGRLALRHRHRSSPRPCRPSQPRSSHVPTAADIQEEVTCSSSVRRSTS